MVLISVPSGLQGAIVPFQQAMQSAGDVGLSSPPVTFSEGESSVVSIRTPSRLIEIEFFEQLSDKLDITRAWHPKSPNDTKIQLVYIDGMLSDSDLDRIRSHINFFCDQIFIPKSGKERDLAEYWNCGGVAHSFFSRTSFNYNAQNQLGHLGWLMAALCLDFSDEDALLIAHLGRSVSRETWLRNSHELLAIAKPTSLKETEGIDNRIDISKFTLYPVVPNTRILELLLTKGVKTVQLRIKDCSDLAVVEQDIKRAIELGDQYNAQVFINDYWQLACKHSAYGVHLGQEDLLTADIDEIRKNGVRLGISTHGYFELIKALTIVPSYIALGHIFPTTTKEMPSKPQGLVRLALYRHFIKESVGKDNGPAIPTVAIGGIDLANATAVLKTGVDCLSVVRAVTEAKNLDASLEAFHKHFSERVKGALYG
jgi:thiamine-phosphate diphosphorylase